MLGSFDDYWADRLGLLPETVASLTKDLRYALGSRTQSVRSFASARRRSNMEIKVETTTANAAQ